MIYDTSKILEVLTLEEILKHTTEYDIYFHYLGSKFEVGRVMSSPFRKDLKPSFGVFKSSTSTALLWKDQATGEIGNVVTFVRKFNNLYHNKQALKLIWYEVVKGNLSTSDKGAMILENLKTTKTIISIKRKNFTEVDDEYWNQYHIDRNILKRFNVFPISFFWINDIIQSFIYTKESPMYAYKIFNKFKIYRPLSKLKKDKWRTNCSSLDLQGYEQLPETGDLLILTKSLKDVMVLYNLGYNAIALQSENDHLDKDIYESLCERFKNIVIFFDNDDPGIKSAVKLSEKYDMRYIHLDSVLHTVYNIKDISDYIKDFGWVSTVDCMNCLLNWLPSGLRKDNTIMDTCIPQEKKVS